MPNGDAVMPDPILVGRNAGEARGARRRRTASRAGRTDLDAALADPRRHDLLRCRHRRSCARRCSAGDRRRQAHLLREADRRPTLDEALRARAAGARRRGVKHGVVQDKLFLPGLLKLKHAARRRLLRPHAVACAASSATGCSRATAAGAAPVLELPQGGRRRHHPRHAVPLALRARQPVRRGAGRVAASARRTSRSAGTRTASPTRRPPTTPPTRRSQLDGGVIAQINMSWATRVRRDDLVTFQVDGTHGSRGRRAAASAAPSRASTRRKPVWNPDMPQPIDFFDELAGSAGRRRSTTTASRSQWEHLHPPRRRGRAVPLGPARRRQGRAARRARRCRAGASGAGSTCRRCNRWSQRSDCRETLSGMRSDPTGSI